MAFIIKPLVTEKQSKITEKNASRYGFIVRPEANKLQIKKEVEALYNVTVAEVNTLRYAGKRSSRYTKAGLIKGQKNAFKKAIVTVKDGDTIAIPSDATNGGRALKVLESAGVIKVNPDAGYTPTLSDITENPKNIKFTEVEAANTPSLLPDVAAAVINGGHAVDNGLNPENDSIFLEKVQEGTDNPYVNVIVARSEDKDNENYKKIVKAYQSDDVKKVIEDVYKGAYLPAWK